jgi:hypothetical protein
VCRPPRVRGADPRAATPARRRRPGRVATRLGHRRTGPVARVPSAR